MKYERASASESRERSGDRGVPARERVGGTAGAKPPGLKSKCNIRDPLWTIKDRIVSALAATSVAELAADLSSPAAPGAVPVAVVRR